MFVTLALQTLLAVYPAPREPEGPDKGPGYLGVQFQAADEGGMLVTEVRDKSPAQAAGLLVNDTILRFDGQLLNDSDGFVKMIVRTRPGTVVPTEIRREGKRMTVRVKIGVRPDDFPVVLPEPQLTPLPRR